MSTEYVALQRRWTVDEAISFLRTEIEDADQTFYLYVVDDDEHLRFAFLANDTFSQTDGRALADQVARLIGAYPAVPAPGEVVPAP